MKKIIIGLIAIAIIAFAAQIVINKEKTAQIVTAINDLGTLTSTDRASAVERFAGKPTVIFIAGTFCPHCQTAMPIYKSAVWDVYKDSVNIFTQVTDGENGDRFEVADIPQGFDANLDFRSLTGEECGYVPSWVMLDAAGVVTDSSCGAAKGVEVITTALDAQLTQ